MAPRKLPMPVSQKGVAIANKLPEFGSVLRGMGFTEATVKIKDDRSTIHGKLSNGTNVSIKMRKNDVYSEISAVASNKINPKRRLIEVKKLRKEGLTQVEIAARLGVSQKTISNDLAK